MATERDLFATDTEKPTQPSLTGGVASSPLKRDILPTPMPGEMRTMMAGAPSPAAPQAAQPQSLAPPPAAHSPPFAPTPTPTPSTPATPGAQTHQQPAGAVPTAPVVAAPVLSTVKDEETVAGQLRKLLDTDSPVLKQARDRATVYAAGRGLQNSTLAAQAGQEAMIGAATPIAATDAQTYSQRSILNTTTQNEFGGRQQQIEGSSRIQAEGAAQRLVEQAQAGDINSRLQLEQAGYDFNLSVQENIHKLQQLAAQGDVEAKLALQKFGFDTSLQSQQGQIQKDLQADQHFQRLIEQAQAGDINSRLQLEQSGYNSNLSAQENRQRLEQLSAEGDIQGKLALQQFNYQTMLASQQQGFAIDLSDKAFQQNQQLLVDEYAQRLGLSTAESAMTIERMNVQHSQTLEQIAAQGHIQGGADAAAWTRNLQAAYLNSVTQRQMAASQEIQTIYSTQGLTSAQQSAAVANARARLQSDITAMAAYFQQTPGWPTQGGGNVPAPAPGQPPGPGPNTPYTPRNPPISTLGPGETRFETPIGPPINAGGGASNGPKGGRRQPV